MPAGFCTKTDSDASKATACHSIHCRTGRIVLLYLAIAPARLSQTALLTAAVRRMTKVRCDRPAP